MMPLRLGIQCMWIWHCFWRKSIRFWRMSSSNIGFALLFEFSLYRVIWLSVYSQIPLFLGAFLLYIAIASLIACSSASVMIILLETFFALLSLTGPWVNTTAVPVPVSTPFFRICDASIYTIMFFAFLIILFVKICL